MYCTQNLMYFELVGQSVQNSATCVLLFYNSEVVSLIMYVHSGFPRHNGYIMNLRVMVLLTLISQDMLHLTPLAYTVMDASTAWLL
jgi:hypothetical protein